MSAAIAQAITDKLRILIMTTSAYRMSSLPLSHIRRPINRHHVIKMQSGIVAIPSVIYDLTGIGIYHGHSAIKPHPEF